MPGSERRSYPSSFQDLMLWRVDKVLLVSFPKSGSNWVRYCIEHFSGGATPGSKRQLLHPDAAPPAKCSAVK